MKYYDNINDNKEEIDINDVYIRDDRKNITLSSPPEGIIDVGLDYGFDDDIDDDIDDGFIDDRNYNREINIDNYYNDIADTI